MTTMWSERHAMVRRIRSSTGWIGEALRRHIGEGDAMEAALGRVGGGIAAPRLPGRTRGHPTVRSCDR